MSTIETVHVSIDEPTRYTCAILSREKGAVQNGHGSVDERGIEEEDDGP